MDQLATEPRNHPIQKHWPYGIIGLSGVLDNVIVNLEQCGRIDYNGMLQSFSITDVLRARIPDFEHMLYKVMEIEKETGRQASILYVLDLTNLQYNKQLYQLVVGPMRRLAEFIAEHYVELIKYFVLVNVPAFVYALWTIVRPLLPERTRHKVRILSSSDWRHEILEYANASILPEMWNLPDERIFSATVPMPIKFPEIGYYKPEIDKLPCKTDEVLVPAGKSLFLTEELKAGDKLTIWLKADGDFGFGIFYANNDAKEEDIDKMETIYPSFGCIPGPIIVPLEDTIPADKDGLYKIYFSNTRAWWHTLTVHYVFRVIPS